MDRLNAVEGIVTGVIIYKNNRNLIFSHGRSGSFRLWN